MTRSVQLRAVVAASAIVSMASSNAGSPGTAQNDEGRVYFIGQGAAVNGRQFTDIPSFAADVPCVRPGDSVRLEAGRTFTGPLRLRVCDGVGGDQRPIVVRSFDGSDPEGGAAGIRPAIIDASRGADGTGRSWIRDEETAALVGIRPVHPPLGVYRMGPFDDGDVAEVFQQDKRLLRARMPSEPRDAAGSRFLRADSIQDASNGCPRAVCLTTSARSLRAIGQRTSTSAYAIVRNSPWSFAVSPVVRLDTAAGDVHLSEAISGAGLPMDTLPVAGHGFILVDDPALLDAEGEWWFDQQGRNLYLAWSADTPPEATKTRVVQPVSGDAELYTHDNAGLAVWGGTDFHLQRFELQISNVSVVCAAGPGIRVLRVPSLRISEVRIDRPAAGGIVLHDIGERAVVERSHITDAPGNGVIATSTSDLVVRNNFIDGAGRVANQRQLGMDLNGVRASGFVRAEITGNEISGSGSAAIMLTEPDSGTPLHPGFRIEIAGNRINRFCVLLNDCGAVYINGNKRADDAARTLAKRIADNRVEAPVGNMDGLPGQGDAVARARGKAADFRRTVAAVFLDFDASGYDITGNQIRGHYTPYGWRLFYQGTSNACSRDAVNECSDVQKGADCYLRQLERCNVIVRTR